MAKKAAKKPTVPIGPQHTSYVKVPLSLGLKGSRVSLYHVTKNGMPTVINTPPDMTKVRWVLVHFPSRRCLVVPSEQKGRAILEIIRKGENYENLIPVKITKSRASKVAHAGASKGPVHGQGSNDSQGSEKEDAETFTAIAEGANFDEAMQQVFSVQRLMNNAERLLKADEPVFDREGKEVGRKPVYGTQFQMLKSLLEYHQGRPTEKEKPPLEKTRASYDDLVAWVESDEDALAHMEGLCRQARLNAKAKKAAAAAQAPAVKSS